MIIPADSRGINDYQLIKNNLYLLGREDEIHKPWTYRWYIIAYCFLPATVVLFLTSYLNETSLLILSGHIALAIGTYVALYQLDNKPLLNPIQAVVFLFHWWFAIGPVLAIVFSILNNDQAMFEKYITSGGVALWIVAFGLPLYAFCANGTLRICRGNIPQVSFLLPDGLLYRQKTLIAYWIVGFTMVAIVKFLAQIGIVGNVPINYLGGTISENWVVSIMEAIGGISFFGTVGAMAYLTGPKQQESPTFKAIAIVLIIYTTVVSFTSGWKGAVVQIFLVLFIVSYVWKQRVPLFLLIFLALFYLFIVEPFVSQMRIAAQVAKITTPAERVELVKDFMGMGIPIDEVSDVDINIESPFRGIFDYADRIVTDSSLFNGPWNNTPVEGMSALVPRVLYPDKPDTNMGNFFAHYLGVAGIDSEMNIGVSIPFEIVGNYGYIPGVLSFGFIGILWTIFCVCLFSEERLATHPLAPLGIIYGMKMEASVQQFFAGFRNLPLVLGAAYLVWLILKKRI